MTLDEKVFNLIKIICESKITDGNEYSVDDIIDIRTENNGDIWFVDIIIENIKLISFTELKHHINFIYCNRIDLIYIKSIFETSYFHHVIIYGRNYFDEMCNKIPSIILCEYYNDIINYFLTNFERIENV